MQKESNLASALNYHVLSCDEIEATKNTEKFKNIGIETTIRRLQKEHRQYWMIQFVPQTDRIILGGTAIVFVDRCDGAILELFWLE